MQQTPLKLASAIFVNVHLLISLAHHAAHRQTAIVHRMPHGHGRHHRLPLPVQLQLSVQFLTQLPKINLFQTALVQNQAELISTQPVDIPQPPK